MGRADRETKRSQLLEAAASIFMRVGFAQATMGMFAAAAGMSRPAAYLLYPGKAELFAAVVKDLNDRLVDRLAAEVVSLTSVRAAVRHVLLEWHASVFDVHTLHPDARDMDDLGFEAVRGVYERLIGLLKSLLGRAHAAGAVDDVAEMARVLAFATRGCRLAAVDRADMQSMIAALIDRAVPA